MDSQEWERERQSQNDYLREQLHAIDKAPGRRRRYQLFVLRCQRCGDVLLEVIETDPYWSVRIRHAESPEDSPPRPPAGSRVSEVQAHYRAHFEGRERPARLRLDKRWSFFAITTEMSRDERREVDVACRCATNLAGSVALRWVYERLAAGDRSATRKTG